MGIGPRPESPKSYFATPSDYVPKCNGDKVAVWVHNTFVKYHTELGYPDPDKCGPAFLVTNDLVRKLFGLTELATQHNVSAIVADPEFFEALASLFRAYNEPRETCCSWWFSVSLDQWKTLECTKGIIEIQRQIGNDDVVAMLS